MTVIAHRGGSLEAPENTLWALERSVRLGTGWQEVDVGLSGDGVATILHDDSLLRTTGAKGRLEELHFAEISMLMAHRPKPSSDTLAAMAREGILEPPTFTPDEVAFSPKLRVPSLRQALAIPNSRYMLELKVTKTPEALIQAVLRDVDAAQARDRVALASFDWDLLSLAQRHAPGIPRIGVAETIDQARNLLLLPIACLAVHCDLAFEVRATVPPDVALWCWTVYTAAQAERLRVLGVDGVITDAPKAVMQHVTGGLSPGAV